MLSKFFLGEGKPNRTFLGKPSENVNDFIVQKRIQAPLCFEALEDNVDIKLQNYSAPTIYLVYSFDSTLDNTKWPKYTLNSTINLQHAGDKLYFKADVISNETICISDNVGYQFILSKACKASGNLQTLFSADGSRTDAPSNCFNRLFEDAKITTAPDLFATTLNQSCYKHMFLNCTNLIQPPKMYAITLANECYGGMFSGCTQLASAPLLFASTLQSSSYINMFYNCSSLSFIEVNFTEWGNNLETNAWVKNVSQHGTCVCPTQLGTNNTISRGISWCPDGWTVVNK